MESPPDRDNETAVQRAAARATKKVGAVKSAPTREDEGGRNQIDQTTDTSCNGQSRRLIGPSGLDYYFD